MFFTMEKSLQLDCPKITSFWVEMGCVAEKARNAQTLLSREYYKGAVCLLPVFFSNIKPSEHIASVFQRLFCLP